MQKALLRLHIWYLEHLKLIPVHFFTHLCFFHHTFLSRKVTGINGFTLFWSSQIKAHNLT